MRYRAGGTVPVQVTVPDYVIAGERLTVGIALDPEIRHAIQVSIVNEHGQVVVQR